MRSIRGLFGGLSQAVDLGILHSCCSFTISISSSFIPFCRLERGEKRLYSALKESLKGAEELEES